MEENVDNNLETPNIQNTNSDNTSGIKSWQINTIIILGLLLLITLGLIFYVIAFKKSSNNNLVSLKTTSTTKKAVTVANPYKGWLTYTNSTYRYSFKYPSSWKLYTSNYPNIVFGSNTTANSQTSAEVELLNTDGAHIIFTYNLTGLGGGNQLVSKIEKFNMNNTQYDLVFLASNSQSSCPQIYGKASFTFPSSLLPRSCIQNTNKVVLVSSNQTKSIQNINGNYYVSIPLIDTNISDPAINVNTNNAVGSISLTLSSAININSINTNSNIKVFENLLKSLQLP
ncbi:hypothetical protein M1145_02965 [Patescibacteria group bacterium]|nr:hypothetical protein [Patescibacteria group bacterium]